MDTRKLDCGHEVGAGDTVGHFDGASVCGACAYIIERLDMKRAGDSAQGVYGVYLYAPDGERPTQAHTWGGHTLGTVVSAKRVRLSRTSWVHGSHMWAVQVRDVHGRMWHGRGSAGISCTLRRMSDNSRKAG